MKTTGFVGEAIRIAVWDAANATTKVDWERVMEGLKKLNNDAYEWLKGKPADQWSMSHFDTYPKCDLVYNNLCESWNSALVTTREMPILSCLEEIRIGLMTRLQECRDIVRTNKRWKGRLCKKIMNLVHKLDDEDTRQCTPIKSSDVHYEVNYNKNGTRYAVDLEKKPCACRAWDLTRILCKHACSALCY